MGRSVKKGPFIDYHLSEKIERAKKKETKKLLKLGLVAQQLLRMQ